MKHITFDIYLIAGMSASTFSPTIMVDKPYDAIHTEFTWHELTELGVRYVSDLIELSKARNPDLQTQIGSYGMENFCYQTVYLKKGDYLIGLQEDKELTSIFTYFQTDHLEFAFLYVAGGASRNHMGYKFVVHLSREQIHAHEPHVHVERDGVSVRYSLDTFERFSKDEPSWEHRRDEKKVILPYLKKNKALLMEYWDLAMNGFLPPQRDENGRQYCAES